MASGRDAIGNITRMDNAIVGIEKRLLNVRQQYENVIKQFETAKIEVAKTFFSEEELQAKSKRLDELNILLNMDEKRQRAGKIIMDEADSILFHHI